MILGNPLLQQVSVINFPGPECCVFCIFIFDLISKSTLALYNLLRASNYQYNKGPLKFKFIKCKKYTADCYLLPFYSKYCYRELSKLFLFLCLWDRKTKRYIMCYFTLTQNYYLILDMFYIKLSWNFFSQISNQWYPEYFLSQFLEQSKKSIKFDLNQQKNSQNNKFLLPPHIDHWKTKKYRGQKIVTR